jgi:hypothetical protein
MSLYNKQEKCELANGRMDACSKKVDVAILETKRRPMNCDKCTAWAGI